MDELLKLAERCEQAAGPDVGIDNGISYAVVTANWSEHDPRWNASVNYRRSATVSNHIAEVFGEVAKALIPTWRQIVIAGTVQAAVILLALYGLAHLVGLVR